ncbi:MAG: two component Transcriptional regulator, Winged helix family protein [Osedax symbiont Rs2]|nr:MAG: two component Transcriptional regulator, Winged helix family protein [Osedax symbiont Rs2]
MKILLIEDDRSLAQGVETSLKRRGYQIESFLRGDHGLLAIRDLSADVIILDLNLPVLDGLEVLRQARAKGVTTPVLITTARDAIAQRIQGLDLGADDYLLKPFDMDELDARIRALYRRAHGGRSDELKYNDIQVLTSARQVYLKGELIELSRREYDLLLLLLDNKAQVLTRRQLEENLYEDEPESNALEVHVHNLRKKLGKQLITTVRGVGYFVAA